MLRDCSLESDPADMHCKTDSLEDGGVSISINIVAIPIPITITIPITIPITNIQTIHVCDCEGEFCNKDFASAGENGDDQSVMV